MSRSINTPISETGELELTNETALGSLMAIGALYHTGKRGPIGLPVMQTDKEGLARLDNDADTAITTIMNGVEALGDLLVGAKADPPSEKTLLAIGWLMQALGEIGCQLQDARRMIRNSASS